MLRAYMVFGGHGPNLVVTRDGEGLQGASAQENLAAKGIVKFIAFEVPPSRVEEVYGPRYQAAVARLSNEKDIRVVDMDGYNVFSNFHFAEMGEPVFVGED